MNKNSGWKILGVENLAIKKFGRQKKLGGSQNKKSRQTGSEARLFCTN